MSLRWQISAGELFELVRPAAFALSALASTWVFAGARRQGSKLYSVAAWALGTLFYPFIVLPIYLIVRTARKRQQRAAQPLVQPVESAASPAEQTTEPAAETKAETTPETTPRLRWALPLLYLLAALSLGALSYYHDAQSIEAHLARANRARLLGNRNEAIREYRVALKLEDNAHTHNLLGIELAAAGQPEEALLELRAAESAGEPDDQLPYRIATTLDTLNRFAEAAPEYQKFLTTRRCTTEYPDPLCAAARARVERKL